MTATDLRNLFMLAAIWGGSFLFMRLAVVDFGTWPLMLVRVGVAALALWLVVIWKGKWQAFHGYIWAILIVGVINAAIPFSLYAYAAQHVASSTLAIVNALTPLFGALIARLWLREKLNLWRSIGLIIGFGGILALVYPSLFLSDGNERWAILASIAATISYGVAASFSTKYLQGADSLVVATGSLSAAALCVAPLAYWYWPEKTIHIGSWSAALALALLCTALAYIIFYRLIASIGGARSITVTFLVPPFGIIWGVLLLNEPFGLNDLICTLFVLIGTLLATGFLPRKST